MGNIAPSFVMVHPNHVEPGVIMPYFQASGAFETLFGGQPRNQLSEGDLYVYVNRMDLRTVDAAGQSAYNSLPSVSTAMSQISTPTYLMRVRGEWDHHDAAAMGRWNVNIVEAQRLGMRQSHAQLMRSALLYGLNPQNGEGLLNTVGATAVPLPPDPNGNDTARTYDNGAMSFFLLSQVSALKTATFQLGIGRKFTILGPQRILGPWEYQDIVQVTQFQRDGAGTTSTAGVVKDVLEMNGDEIAWCYDDTLIGKGAGGTDAVLIVMPEVEQPEGITVNTNVFADLKPSIEACTLMYTDVAAPREITTPLAGGATDMLTEQRITSGWGVRGEAVRIISIEY